MREMLCAELTRQACGLDKLVYTIHMRHATFIVAGIAMVLVLGGCRSAAEAQARQERWSVYERSVRVEFEPACKRKECQKIASMLEGYVRDSSRGLDPDSYNLAKHTRDAVAACPSLRESLAEWVDQNLPRMSEPALTMNEYDAWLDVARAIDHPEPLIRLTESAKENALVRKRLVVSRLSREDLAKELKRAGRSDLLSVLRPDPITGLLEGGGDVLFGAVSLVVAPVLYPLWFNGPR